MLRRARHGGSLPPGLARPAPDHRHQGRRTAAAVARHVLGVQRRSHQPALARLAAPVRRATARCAARRADAAARRERRLALGGLRRRVGRTAAWVQFGVGVRGNVRGGFSGCNRRRHAPRAVGARRNALGRRPVDQRARPGAHCATAAGRRLARRRATVAGALGGAHAPALRHGAVLRLADVVEPRRQDLPRFVGGQQLHGRCRWALCVDRAGARGGGGGALDRPGARARVRRPSGRGARDAEWRVAR